jgi:hypothetical protein
VDPVGLLGDWCHSAAVDRGVIIEVLRVFEESGWRVSLCRSNYRPERSFIEIERSASADDVESWCVGFADESGEAERLFDTTVRSVRLLATGQVDPVDWFEGPDGVDLI